MEKQTNLKTRFEKIARIREEMAGRLVDGVIYLKQVETGRILQCDPHVGAPGVYDHVFEYATPDEIKAYKKAQSDEAQRLVNVAASRVQPYYPPTVVQALRKATAKE